MPHKIGKVASLKGRRYYSSPNFETFFEAEQKMHEYTPPDRIIFKIWGMWLIAFHSSFYITVIDCIEESSEVLIQYCVPWGFQTCHKMEKSSNKRNPDFLRIF